MSKIDLINSPPYTDLTFAQIEETLGKLVTIKLKNGEKFEGHLYNIDPVTFTIGDLYTVDELPSRYKILIIKDFDISEFKVNNDKDAIPRNLLDSVVNKYTEDYTINSEKMRQRREKLISLFTSQRIPVTHNEDESIIHIMGRAHISPPYVVSSIECDNEIILERGKRGRGAKREYRKDKRGYKEVGRCQEGGE
ncbi:16901_t:CDS:2, partial [Dentiscutata erythropus]